MQYFNVILVFTGRTWDTYLFPRNVWVGSRKQNGESTPCSLRFLTRHKCDCYTSDVARIQSLKLFLHWATNVPHSGLSCGHTTITITWWLTAVFWVRTVDINGYLFPVLSYLSLWLCKQKSLLHILYSCFLC